MAGRLDKKTFYKSMVYLKNKYLNFKLDVNNVAAINIWYNEFKHLTNDQMQELVKNYKQEHAPSSPQSLLKQIDDIQDSKDSAEEFAQYLLQLNREHGFNWNAEKCRIKIQERYGSAGYATTLLFADTLKNLQTTDVPIIAAQIREAYKQQKSKIKYKNEFASLFAGVNKHSKRLESDED